VSLLLPANTWRNNVGENPPKYDCGLPLAFIAGRSERPWRIANAVRTPVTQPGQSPVTATRADFDKSAVCKQAMAPRLGFTAWVLGLGLLLALVGAVAGARVRAPGRARSSP
jgi:hypothetical protein